MTKEQEEKLYKITLNDIDFWLVNVASIYDLECIRSIVLTELLIKTNDC